MDADRFMRVIIRDLSGTLQDTIGLEDAKGFISVVGARIGDQFDALYRAALKQAFLGRAEVALALVDLKRRIGGDFFIIEESDEKIVLGNRVCPFGTYVEGRPALCMMTSNVFGRIAAENLGYAKVNVEEAIANGHKGCRVVVYLNRHGEAAEALGREYYSVEARQ
ncbi:MAG: methanogen output domain 1-containing protein [Alphaproteobacteria bacterium]